VPNVVRSCRSADGVAYLVKGFSVSAFYEVLAAVAAARRRTWRAVSRETGVPAATLTRMTRGECPDAAALAALSAWARLNPGDFVVAPAGAQTPSSLRTILAILRSDPTLEPNAAQDMEAIVRLAYSMLGADALRGAHTGPSPARSILRSAAAGLPGRARPASGPMASTEEVTARPPRARRQ
jgi:hypothetical protein